MPRVSDPLADLLTLPGVAASAEAARAAIDGLLWDRALRPRIGELVVESRLRGGWASAALDGADVRPESIRDESAMDGSPMGRVVAASLRLQAETARQVSVAERAPLQALARLHAVTAHGFSPAEELGRPRSGPVADDPLRLGPPPDAANAARRLEDLAGLLTRPSAAPAVVLAAVVHGELLAIRPFAWGSGLLARASVRLVLAMRGVDPDLVSIPEAGLLAAGRTAYVRAIRGYLGASRDGVGQWLVFCAEALVTGAQETRRAYAALPPP